jgi:hypothetical protein
MLAGGILAALAAVASADDKKGTKVELGGETATTPSTWVKQTPKKTGIPRAYQFALPKADGDKKDAEVVIWEGLGGSVSANTGTGDIDVRMKGAPIDGDMRFVSGTGSIHVTLPADFNGRVDASSGSGTLRSEFEISVLGRLNAQHVRGTIGRGGPLIRMSTGSGMIELNKG